MNRNNERGILTAVHLPSSASVAWTWNRSHRFGKNFVAIRKARSKHVYGRL